MGACHRRARTGLTYGSQMSAQEKIKLALTYVDASCVGGRRTFASRGS
jgi:hypothetical protein